MNTKLGLSAVLLSMLVTVGNVHANTVIHNQTVKKTHINLYSGYFFQTVAPVQNPDNCQNTSWYRLPANAAYAKEAFSILLAAVSSGQPVQLNLNGCEDIYPRVTWINVFREN